MSGPAVGRSALASTGASGRAWRAPAALVPAPAARLAGLAVLALVGGLQWRRMVEGVGVGRVLLWVLVAVAAAVALVVADRLGRHRESATLGATTAALLAALAASGVPLALLKPARWDTLADGVLRGTEALGGVWLPYAGADPWPGLVLQLLGALLCVLAALLAFWPRDGGRGYQFIALAALLSLVVTPVVSLGGARPLLLGGVLTAGTVAFLWLERLPLRPGLGVAALLAIALAGAVPLAGVADRGEPWFDYRGFAEGLGPDDPVRFAWTQGYGAMQWPRNRSEIVRVRAARPSYWKLRTLEEFDGVAWGDRRAAAGRPDPEPDLPYGWRARPQWVEEIQVSLRRLRGPEVVGAGTILDVRHSTAAVRPFGEPGAWRGLSELGGGDSYSARVYVPRPSAAELDESSTGRHADELGLRVPISDGGPDWVARRSRGLPVREAVVRFRPFKRDGFEPPSAAYPAVNRSGDGAEALRHSPYARTWRLAQRLRAQAATPYEYVTLVAARLRDGFHYDEQPPAAPPGQAPLEAFLFEGRRGYCQQFAGAMALLLRMGGVPARVAAGFTPGGFSERKDAWIVRDTDAHVWVEGWFDRFGWVALDPTPPATPARSQIASLTPVAGPGADLGTLGAEGLTRQGASREPKPSGPTRPNAGGAGDAGGASASDDAGPFEGPWLWLALAGASAVAAWPVARRRRRGRDSGEGRGVDRAIAELEAALRRCGRPAAPNVTLRQLEERLGGSPEAAAYLRALRSGRYGPAHALPPLPTPAQRRALRRALASGGLSGRLRALWALPPWRR